MPRRYPGFGPRNVPPPGRMEIDPRLAPRGLVWSVLPTTPNWRDLAGGRTPVITNTPRLGTTPRGPGIVAGSAGALGYNFGTPVPLAYSIEVLVQAGSSSGAANETVFTFNAGAQGALATYDHQIAGNSSGQYFYYGSGAGTWTDPGTAFQANRVAHVCATATGGGSGTYVLYVDGVAVASGTAGDAYTGFNPLWVCLSSQAQAWSGAILLANMATVAWSASEVAARAAEPFSMFRPAPRRIWFAPAAGGSNALAGTAAAAASTTGTLVGVGALAGTAAEATTTSGPVTSPAALAGTAAAAAVTTGAVTSPVALAGTAAAAVATTGTLTGVGALAGTAAEATTTTGTVASPGVLAGTAAAATATTGTLTGRGALAGTAAAAASTTGTVGNVGTGPLAGTAAVIATTTGTLSELVALAASPAAAAATTTGTLTGRGAVAGTAAAAAATTGTLTARGAVAGTAAAAAATAGAVTDNIGDLAGVVAIQANAVAILRGIGALSGIAVGAAAAHGFLAVPVRSAGRPMIVPPDYPALRLPADPKMRARSE